MTLPGERRPAEPAITGLHGVRLSALRLLLAACWLIGAALVFLPQAWLEDARFWLFCGFLVLALPSAKRTTLFLLVPVALIEAWRGLTIGDWSAVHQGISLSAFFTLFLPTLMLMRETARASPKLGEARAAFVALDARARGAGLTIAGQVLGSVLNMGALAVTAPMVTDAAEERTRAHYARAVLRGYAMAFPWSPFMVAMAFAQTARPDVPFVQILAVGMAVGLGGMLLSLSVFGGGFSRGAVRRAFSIFQPIAFDLAVALGAVVAVASLFPVSTVGAIALTIPPLCLVRLGTLGSGVTQRTLQSAYHRFAEVSDELLLFTAAVTLSALLETSGMMHAGLDALGLTDAPVLVLLLFIAGLGPLLALIGLHPIAAASVALVALNPLDARLPDLVEIQALLFVWYCGAAMSPASLSVNVATGLYRVSLRSLVLDRNGPFLLLFGACLSLVAWLITLSL